MPIHTWMMPRHMWPCWAGHELIDKAAALKLTVPQMTALVGGLRALGANTGRAFLLKTTERWYATMVTCLNCRQGCRSSQQKYPYDPRNSCITPSISA